MTFYANKDDYVVCVKCETAFRKGTAHTEQQCFHNRNEKYIKHRIRWGVFKGMLYALSITYMLCSSTMLALANEVAKVYKQMNEILMEGEDVKNETIIAMAKLIKLIK